MESIGMIIHFFSPVVVAGSESPATTFCGGSADGKTNPLVASLNSEAEQYRKMAKMLIGTKEDNQLSNEISAPYEVPQYPIEQIETKLIR